MSVCTTCLKPGLPADGHDCPGLGDIRLTRQFGRGIVVDVAPARARLALNVLTDHGWGAAMRGPSQINIAYQVLYQVVGYDPISASLVLELIEDWRAPDAAVCTPIPAETLRQLSEVPPELLTEQQRTRADNAEARLHLAREALIADGYFCRDDEIGDDIAPRITELSNARLEATRKVIKERDAAEERAAEVETELARLRAGEESGWEPMTVPTPGQWITHFNRADAAGRLDMAQRVIDCAATASTCFEMNHVRRLEEDQLRRTRIELEHWQSVIVPELRDERDTARTALREVLAAFATVTSPTSGTVMGHQAPPIHPDDMDRWRAALEPQGAAVSGYPTPEMRKKMQDVKPGTPPSGPAGASSANGKRILIDAPDGATILAARHLDATEGRVQIGSTVDTATRSAITQVLRYIAKAHNSPAAPAEQDCARDHDEGADRVRALHVRNPHSGTCEHCSAGDYPNYAVPWPCPTMRALDKKQSDG